MEDPLITCPFEESHRISRSRMQYHMVRCAKNHSMNGRAKCPYNPLHIVSASELLHHCTNCPDNETVQRQQYSRGERPCFSNVLTHEEAIKELAKSYPMNDNSTELRHGITGPGYDPNAEIEKKPVLRFLNAESKSKREKFRKEERQRHANLMREQEEEKVKSILQPLRRPHQKQSVWVQVDNAYHEAQSPLKVENDSTMNGIANGHKTKELKDDTDDFDLDTNENKIEIYKKLEALKEKQKDNEEKNKKIEEERISIQNHKKKIQELEKHVNEQVQSIDEENKMLEEQQAKLLEALKNCSINETNNDTDVKSKSPSTNGPTTTTPTTTTTTTIIAVKPKQNPKCAANFDPSSSSSSSPLKAPGGTNGVRACGRGVVHAYINQTVNLPKVGRPPQ